MMTNATVNGIKFLFTIAIVVTFAISAVAIITPATGDTVRPIDAESCIGKMIEDDSTPNFEAIFGTNGPKAKKEAFPLPMSMDARKIIIVITTPMPTAPNPIFCAMANKPSMNPRLIKPLAKISAVIISVTTVLNIFPIPFQKMFNELRTSLKFRTLKNSQINATNRLMNMAVVVSKTIGVGNRLKSSENTINKIMGNTGMMA